MDGVSIARATTADIAEIQRLANLTWRSCYPGIISNEQIDYMLEWMYSTERLHQEISREGITFLLARVNGGNAGFASFGPEDPKRWKIHKLYVDPAHQRRGLALRLLEEIDKSARKNGVEELILAVNKKNLKAIEFYERRGFVIMRGVKGDIGGGYVMDDFVMRRVSR